MGKPGRVEAVKLLQRCRLPYGFRKVEGLVSFIGAQHRGRRAALRTLEKEVVVGLEPVVMVLLPNARRFHTPLQLLQESPPAPK
eukprot:scaffold8216_cov315-Pinguiococcus_pyrenoidosus.AAC.1